jgi:hypothetical protein
LGVQYGWRGPADRPESVAATKCRRPAAAGSKSRNRSGLAVRPRSGPGGRLSLPLRETGRWPMPTGCESTPAGPVQTARARRDSHREAACILVCSAARGPMGIEPCRARLRSIDQQRSAVRSETSRCAMRQPMRVSDVGLEIVLGPGPWGRGQRGGRPGGRPRAAWGGFPGKGLLIKVSSTGCSQRRRRAASGSPRICLWGTKQPQATQVAWGCGRVVVAAGCRPRLTWPSPALAGASEDRRSAGPVRWLRSIPAARRLGRRQ